MTNKKFEIEYVDPETGEWTKIECAFEDLADFPAKVWAEDYGYTLADKGRYRVREKK